ncbi:MAG TPA: alpha-amylase family protein [Thermoanaerobaculia bacterium]|jgi:maltose alpha-D-glucosyltransferase/alpha-amylase|nr:alpha-amylase family protein [Thermoanaerobaculia bacterium]
MIDLWYKDVVIYSLDVDAFQDSNGDGIGDFRGLTRRLDYLASLGVTCLWLLPFYPTPDRDNGYDVKDYYSVDPRLGTLGDFVEFMHQARERGIRVLADLVVNHTSDQHPWFQAARQSKDSPWRDWYVWSDTLPANAHEGMVFPGYQDAVWAWDEVAGAYYFHRFYAHQPDLNISNPAVREEICRIMGFWLELGVSGFRLDAAPFLIEMKKAAAPGEEQYAYLREFRDFLSWRRGDAILLAEANVSREKTAQYFGDGAKIHMLFSFLVNQFYFLALAREEAAPLVQGLQLPPRPPETGQWANFVRNHDELDLGRLSDEERQLVFSRFAPDPNMQLYGRGIRRRLPPMLGNDRSRLELAYSLEFSLPGTPVLRYGEEIAMGDDLSRPERESVRTAMQWSNEPNGGFSTAPPEKLLRSVIAEGEYGYEKVNVDAQQRDPGSLFHWMERLIRVRKQCPEVGWGDWEILATGDPAVIALRYRFRGGAVVTVHNLAGKPAAVRLDGGEPGKPWTELLGDQPYALVDGSKTIELEPYGYRWFRVDRPLG